MAAVEPGAHQYSKILGVDAHTAIRVAIPLIGGALSFGAFACYARGNTKFGQMLLTAWAGILALSVAASVLEESGRARRALLQDGTQQQALQTVQAATMAF